MISAHKMIKLLHFVLTIYSKKSSNFARKINYLQTGGSAAKPL